MMKSGKTAKEKKEHEARKVPVLQKQKTFVEQVRDQKLGLPPREKAPKSK